MVARKGWTYIAKAANIQGNIINMTNMYNSSKLIKNFSKSPLMAMDTEVNRYNFKFLPFYPLC